MKKSRGTIFGVLLLVLAVSLFLTGCVGGDKGEKGTLRGKIFDENGDPFTGSAVIALDEKLGVIVDSEYSFSNLSAGSKELTVEAEGYVKYIQTITLQAGQDKQHDVNLSKKDDPVPGDFKIVIFTGSQEWAAEPYFAARKMVEQYGESIIHQTYPDSFMSEMEDYVNDLVSYAADEKVRGIVVVQGIPGTVEAFAQIRQEREDMVLIVGAPHEDPALVGSHADLVLNVNEVGRGASIAQLAFKMGAETILHYSFERHMSMQVIHDRLNRMKSTAQSLGIEVVEVEAPDPTVVGIPEAQQFIRENIAEQAQLHGTDIAFFGTSCFMLEPAIQTCLETGIMLVEQCCPSPVHGYPGALSIVLPENALEDINSLLATIQGEIAAKGGTGRFTTWAVPSHMAFVEAGVELVRKNILEGLDFSQITEVQEEMTEILGVETSLEKYDTEGNFYLAILESIIF